jgi:hypothetical protein
LAASSTDNIIPKRFASLFDFFKKIGLEVGQNFIKIANLVSEKIVANRVETKELCIDEVCVNKDQLQALILQSNVQVNSGNAGSLPNATSTDPNATNGQATTTPAVGTGTTTPVTTDTSTTTPSTSTSTPVVDSGTQSTSSSTPSASPADTVSNTDSTSTSTSPVSDAGNNGPTI